MLVLSIPNGQTVKVGEVEIRVLNAGKKTVELGFTGSREIPIVRGNAKKKNGEESPDRA